MSDLETICRQVTEIAGEMKHWAADLEIRAGQIRRSEGRAQTVLRQSPRGASTAVALDTAVRQCQTAAASLNAAKGSAERFVAMHGGRSDRTPNRDETGGGDPGRSASSPLAPFWAAHDGEYIPPDESDWLPVPDTLPAHSDPHDFAPWVNDGGHEKPGRGVNCADCARAVEMSWRGEPQVSAARADGWDGETFARIEEWLGSPLTPSSFSEIGTQLTDAGHGSSAYVVVAWKWPGGHAFNAVNHNGTVYFIDAQPTGGVVDTWPPKRTSSGNGFDESDVSDVFVKVWDRSGNG